MSIIFSILLLFLCGVQRSTCEIEAALDTNEYIIMATKWNISRLQLPAGTTTILPITQLTFPNSVEYDVKHNCVFWADYTRIARQCLDAGDAAVEVLVTGGVHKIIDIAYDWLSETLYYVDAQQICVIDTSARATREALHSNGNHWSKTILKLGAGVTTGIAVHPERGYIFWTQSLDGIEHRNNSDVGIFRANLDGTKKVKLLGQPNAMHPVIISVDYVSNNVYWIDTQAGDGNYVRSCGLNGEKFTQHFSMDSEGQSSQYLLSAYNDVVYWLDAGNNIRGSDIRYLDESDEASQSSVFASNVEMLLDFKAFYRGAHLGTNACSNGRNNCSHLCVGTPNRGTRCLCPNGFIRNASGQCECVAGLGDDCYNWLMQMNCPANGIRCDGKICMPLDYRCGKHIIYFNNDRIHVFL